MDVKKKHLIAWAILLPIALATISFIVVKVSQNYSMVHAYKPPIVKKGGILIGHNGGGFFRTGYKSTERKFDIDDVTLSFGVGNPGAYALDDDQIHELEGSLPEWELWFSNGTIDYKIKTVQENLFLQKYDLSYEWYKGESLAVFPVYEEYTIPRYFFSAERGSLFFELRQPEDNVVAIPPSLNPRELLSRIEIKYVRKDTKVTILQTERFYKYR